MKRHTHVSFNIFQRGGLEKIDMYKFRTLNLEFPASSFDSTAWTAHKFKVYTLHGVHGLQVLFKTGVFEKFRNSQRKTPALESLLNKVAKLEDTDATVSL